MEYAVDLHEKQQDLIQRLVELENGVLQVMGSSSPIYQHLVDVEQELRNWQPYAATPPAIRTIYLERAEGVGAGQALSVRTIDEADAILGVWARTAPARGSGYDKTDVEITFADSSEVRMRVDLNCDTDRYLTNDPSTYAIYVSGDVCRLGREVWSGSEIYSQWALRCAITRCRSNEFVRLVRHPGGRSEDTYILETTVSTDPLSAIKGIALLRKVGNEAPSRSIDGR